jgi:hypothetical protein
MTHPYKRPRTIIVIAQDECRNAVTTIPMKNHPIRHIAANCVKSICVASHPTASLNREIPKNINPNERTILPIPFRV